MVRTLLANTALTALTRLICSFALRCYTKASDVDGEQLFVCRVAPLLYEKCLACHGKDESAIKGGLDIRTRESTLRGGDSETPSIVPDKPERSSLYLAVTPNHDDWAAMPPKEADKLNAEQIAWIRQWIAGGSRRWKAASDTMFRVHSDSGSMAKAGRTWLRTGTICG